MKDFTVFNGVQLPVAFANEENIYYHRLYRMGDLTARDMLIKHNLRLVFMIVIDNFGSINYELEDLMSIGIEGLIKGIDTYDESKNDKMIGYVSKCIKYEILNFFRMENKHKKKNINLISLDDTAMIIDGEEIPYRDVLIINDECFEDMIIEKEMKEFYCQVINQMLGDLSDRDKMIMMLYFGFIDGRRYKQREIAEVVNIDRAGVSRVITSTLKRFRTRLLFNQRFEKVECTNNYSRKLMI